MHLPEYLDMKLGDVRSMMLTPVFVSMQLAFLASSYQKKVLLLFQLGFC